jgi:predicted HTH domain antitoxin
MVRKSKPIRKKVKVKDKFLTSFKEPIIATKGLTQKQILDLHRKLTKNMNKSEKAAFSNKNRGFQLSTTLAAMELIEKENISLRETAEYMGIDVAALSNRIKNLRKETKPWPNLNKSRAKAMDKTRLSIEKSNKYACSMYSPTIRSLLLRGKNHKEIREVINKRLENRNMAKLGVPHIENLIGL